MRESKPTTSFDKKIVPNNFYTSIIICTYMYKTLQVLEDLTQPSKGKATEVPNIHV